MIPVSVAVIPDGAPVWTLGAALGPLGAVALAAVLVTLGVLVVRLAIARRPVRTATSHRRATAMRAAGILPFIAVMGLVGSARAGVMERVAHDEAQARDATTDPDTGDVDGTVRDVCQGLCGPNSVR